MHKKTLYKSPFLLMGILLCLFPLLIEGRAGADDYPNRNVEIIVGFSSGSGQDIAARIAAPYLEEQFKQPFVVLNKTSGGGTNGPREVVKSKPDGHKLGVTSVLYSAAFLNNKDMDYSWNDYAFICTFIKTVSLFSVRKDARWKTFMEFLEEAKANPGKLRYSSYGLYSTTHIFLVELQKKLGIKLVHIPYKGAGEALTALLGGHVDMATTYGSAGHLAAGSIRALATLDKERYEDYPDVPTMTELGFPVSLTSVYGLYAAKGTPKPIMDKLIQGSMSILQKHEQDMIQPLKRLEMRPYIKGPKEFANLVWANDKYMRAIWADLDIR
jgi:tripartite-type tricarboxylate transporter receptor subunit TctC